MNHKPYLLNNIIVIVVVISTLLYANPTTEAQANSVNDEYYFLRSWGGEASQIRYPNAIGVNAKKEIFIVNYDKMTIIEQISRTYKVWPNFYLDETLGVLHPSNMSFDKDGNIYYADKYEHNIKLFSPNGEIIGVWGESGSGEGEFILPSSVAIDSSGFIYVSDTGNKRIQKFSQDMVYLGYFTVDFIPFTLAFDSEDSIYVVDLSNQCVQKFNNAGNHQQSIGENQLVNPRGLAINSSDIIYIVDQNNSKIYLYKNDGSFFGQMGNKGDQPGQFDHPEGIAIDLNDDIYITDTNNHRVQKLTQTGVYLTSWGSKISSLGEFNRPRGLEVDNDGFILIADSENDRIQKFTPYGSFIESWGAPSQFHKPMDLAVDEDGFIYVADSGAGSVQKLDSNGVTIETWDLGPNSLPSSIAINRELQKIYISDNGNSKIVVYNYDGTRHSEWGSRGNGSSQFNNLQGITIDSNGNVYAADTNNSRIQIFNPEGEYIDVIQGYFDHPYDVDVDSNNYLFVVDSLNQRIRIFDVTDDYSFVKAWGIYGRMEGEFIFPTGIAIDESNNIFISDQVKNQVQVFSNQRPQLDPFSGLILNGDFEEEQLNWSVGGELGVSFVSESGESNIAMLLGNQVPQQSQGISQAWAYQTIFVDPSWERPILSLRYNMFVNDIMDYSDFLVAIQDGVGLNHLATVIRDGFQPCIPRVAPAPGRNLGWRSVTYNLSAYKGQYIRVVFANRNLWPISWGIWTYIDDVRVIDAGPLPPRTGTFLTFLPVVSSYRCDPIY